MYPQYPNNFPNSYYPPYYSQYPMMSQPKPSLLNSVKYSISRVSMSTTLRTAQKTLYTVNQIIPIINQLRPVLHNASTAFKVVKAVKEFDFDEIDDEIVNNVNENTETFKNML